MVTQRFNGEKGTLLVLDMGGEGVYDGLRVSREFGSLFTLSKYDL